MNGEVNGVWVSKGVKEGCEGVSVGCLGELGLGEV